DYHCCSTRSDTYIF
nr:immunoglobulin light chain junction region [Macaca mulatta]